MIPGDETSGNRASSWFRFRLSSAWARPRAAQICKMSGRWENIELAYLPCPTLVRPEPIFLDMAIIGFECRTVVLAPFPPAPLAQLLSERLFRERGHIGASGLRLGCQLGVNGQMHCLLCRHAGPCALSMRIVAGDGASDNRARSILRVGPDHLLWPHDGVELARRHIAASDRFLAQGRAVLVRRLGNLSRVVVADLRRQRRDQHQ